MPRIKRLTNENKLVEEKSNFFADWFHYYIANIGNGPEFEVENLLSLIEKIIYQIEFNLNYSHSYLINYLEHTYLQNKNYLSIFDSYNKVSPKLDRIKLLPQSEIIKYVKQDGALKTDLDSFRDEVKEKMFNLSLQEIISYLICIHPLKEHIEGIKFHTKILVSEYLLSGRSRQDIQLVFTRILSDDIKMFPFPKEISTVEDKKHHILNRGLEGQFMGLRHLLDEPETTWTFYIKVYGAYLTAEIHFKYNEVTFISKDHIFFKSATNSISFLSDSDKNYFVASISVKFISQEIAIEEARAKITEELVHLSLRMNRELALDVPFRYMITSDGIRFDEAGGTDKYDNGFDNTIMESLNNTPYHFLKDYPSPAQSHLLKFEYILLNAIKQKSMPGYWHYLEVLMQLGNEEKKVQDKVSSMLLLMEEDRRKRLITYDLKRAFDRFNCPYEYLGLTYEDLSEFQASLNNGQLHPKMYKVSYEMIRILVKEFNRKTSKDKLKEAKKYYVSILKEAYEQRNFYSHQAISNKKSIIKLSHSLLYLIMHFRWLCKLPRKLVHWG